MRKIAADAVPCWQAVDGDFAHPTAPIDHGANVTSWTTAAYPLDAALGGACADNHPSPAVAKILQTAMGQ